MAAKDLGFRDFVNYIPLGLFTEEEIVEKIGTFPTLIGRPAVDLLQALQKLYPTGLPLAVTNALRAVRDLPPLD